MSGDQRGEQLKKLLIKFRRPCTITGGDESEDLQDFATLLDLNAQLANPKNLCITCWSLLNESQTRDHRSYFSHTVMLADMFPSKEQFIAVAKEHGKCQTNDAGAVEQLQTPLSAPPNLTTQNADSQVSHQSQHSQVNSGLVRNALNANYQNFRGDLAQ